MGKEEYIGANRTFDGPNIAMSGRGDFSRDWEKGKEKALATSDTNSGSVQKIENIAVVEEVPKAKLSRRKRLWRHYKRYWCCYAILFVVACAVGFPIL